jgi:hypothetical protein
LAVLGFELRALYFLIKHSSTWTMSPVLFALVYFSDKISCFYLGLASNHDPPTSISHITETTDITTTLGLFLEIGLLNFFSWVGLKQCKCYFRLQHSWYYSCESPCLARKFCFYFLFNFLIFFLLFLHLLTCVYNI